MGLWVSRRRQSHDDRRWRHHVHRRTSHRYGNRRDPGSHYPQYRGRRVQGDSRDGDDAHACQLYASQDAALRDGLRWTRGHREWRLGRARGDLDADLARVPAQQLQWPDGAAAVADRFLAAGRAEDALGILDQAAQAAKSWSSPHWTESRIAALDALGRSDGAQALRWQAFERSLSSPYLRAYLKGLPAFEDGAAEEKAFALVEHHPNPIEALVFLVAWPALPRAATYVLNHWDQDSWDGQDQVPLTAAAERLSGPYPLAATKLYRPLLVEALWQGGAKCHRQAVSHLGTCKDLAAAITDWQGLEDHGAFLAGLRESFAMNWSVRALLGD